MNNDRIADIEREINIGAVHGFWKTAYQYGSQDGRYEVLKELGITDDREFKTASEFCQWFKSAICHMTEDQKIWTAEAMTCGFYEYIYGSDSKQPNNRPELPDSCRKAKQKGYGMSDKVTIMVPVVTEKKPVDIELPFYYEDDVSSDDWGYIVRGKIEKDKHTTIASVCSYRNGDSEMKVSVENINGHDRFSRYTEEAYRSNERDFKEFASDLAEYMKEHLS